MNFPHNLPRCGRLWAKCGQVADGFLAAFFWRHRQRQGPEFPDFPGHFGCRSRCLRTGRPGRPGFSVFSSVFRPNPDLRHRGLRVHGAGTEKDLAPETTNRRPETFSLAAEGSQTRGPQARGTENTEICSFIISHSSLITWPASLLTVFPFTPDSHES